MAEPANPSATASADDTDVRWWEPLAAFVGGNFIGSLLALVAIVVVMIVAAAKGAPLAVNALLYSFTAIMASLALTNIPTLGMLWWLARRRIARPIAHYFAPVSWGLVGLAAASGVAVSLLLNGGNELLSHAKLVTFTETPVERAMVPHGAIQFAVSIAMVTVLAPLVEEFLFRGLLFRWLRRIGGVAVAVPVSALVFGAMHGEAFIHPGVQGWLYTGELMAAGALLAGWVARTGSLRTSFAMHAAYNLTATLLSVLLP